MYSRIAGQCLSGLDRGVERTVKARQVLAAQRWVERPHLPGLQQREAAAVCVRAGYHLVGDRELTFRPQQRQRSGRTEADTTDLGAEFLPQFAGTQRRRQLVGGSARHPDQAEVAHRRPAGLGLALQLDDLVPSADRLESVRGPEDASADDRHAHKPDHSESPRRHQDDKVCWRRTTG